MTNRYLTEPCVCGKQTMAWCMANTCNKAEQSADPMQRKLTYFEDKARQQCWCTTCRPITLTDMRFVVCPDCGNKRCPKANNHQNGCTNSNEIGQKGSSWEHVNPVATQPAQPQQEPVAYKITGKLGDTCSFRGGTNVKKGDFVYTSPAQRKPLTDEQFLDMILRTGTQELVGVTTFVGGSIQMQGKIGLLRSAKIIKEFVEAAHGIKGDA